MVVVYVTSCPGNWDFLAKMCESSWCWEVVISAIIAKTHVLRRGEGLIVSEQYKALQGFKDILPDEQAYWRYVENIAAEVAQLFGYRRIETPILEETTVFRRT